ncbi:hypothetical protein CBR_g29506 [Chara braunii]|uniref:Uncharacterized protein n=1 Tax=Chara braunii TaxID=69332 RepID=A0A388LAL7_CHABU|nr:hypothetical protein CBR_g29506 [Chara braunii]|eukprot:GBG79358.1 hypothetical protein CBR_g29506 [Chara braunii]
MASLSYWIRPEVYPLFAAVGAAVGLCGFHLTRMATSSPDVRVTKESRAAGVLENFEEGRSYKYHPLRELVKNVKPEIMPVLNQRMTTA